MTALVFTTMAVLGITWFDLRPKWQEKDWKVLWISVAFVLAGFVILALSGFGVQVYSPLRPLVELVGRLTGGANG